jgi:hypothetical protein
MNRAEPKGKNPCLRVEWLRAEWSDKPTICLWESNFKFKALISFPAFQGNLLNFLKTTKKTTKKY